MRTAMIVPFERETMPDASERRENPVLNYARVGARLRAARADKRYPSTTAAVVALERHYRARLAAGTLGKYERGDTEVPLHFLVALSLLYEQPLTYFLGPAVTAGPVEFARLNQ